MYTTNWNKILLMIIMIMIIIRDNKQGTYTLTDVAIPGDRNVIKKEAEKILKYKDLAIEMQRMWNVKAKVIPVIIWASGTISKSLSLSNIPGKHEVKEPQKNSRIEHCTQTAGSADVKVQNIVHGRNNITCSTDYKYRRAATLYPRNMVCLRYIRAIVNTLHNGDNKADDDDDDNDNNNNNNNIIIISTTQKLT